MMKSSPDKSRFYRRLVVSLSSFGVVVSGLLFLPRCFNPALPACSYICNHNTLGAPLCPDEYECRADGYCHLRGSSEACPYTMDLRPADIGRPAMDMGPSDAAADM